MGTLDKADQPRNLEAEVEALRIQVESFRQKLIDLESLSNLRWYRTIPFHGQRSRIEIFDEIRNYYQPEAIIETGTHVGNTCAFFAETGLETVSIESDPILFAVAHLRLQDRPNVRLIFGESGSVMAAGSPIEHAERRLFIYLDAHWQESLPLRAEIEAVARNYPNAVVMIDDFEVADDPSYGWDDYGVQARLNLPYIADLVLNCFKLYYPTVTGSQDTGNPRGCIVLARGDRAHVLESFRTLRAVKVNADRK
jgi:hypothetical protein